MSKLLSYLQSGAIRAAPAGYLDELAGREGLNARALRAITVVETGGRSTYDARRRPVFLFEPHHFYRLLPTGKRSLSISRNLGRAGFSRTFYNQFERTPDDRWALLARAAAFHDEESAVGACSWGPAQIVGHLWARACGYASAIEFVRASMDEARMLDAFAVVLLSMDLRAAVNAADFRTVARKYNGSAQVDLYAARMKAAYERLA